MDSKLRAIWGPVDVCTQRQDPPSIFGTRSDNKTYYWKNDDASQSSNITSVSLFQTEEKRQELKKDNDKYFHKMSNASEEVSDDFEAIPVEFRPKITVCNHLPITKTVESVPSKDKLLKSDDTLTLEKKPNHLHGKKKSKRRSRNNTKNKQYPLNEERRPLFFAPGTTNMHKSEYSKTQIQSKLNKGNEKLGARFSKISISSSQEILQINPEEPAPELIRLTSKVSYYTYSPRHNAKTSMFNDKSENSKSVCSQGFNVSSNKPVSMNRKQMKWMSNLSTVKSEVSKIDTDTNTEVYYNKKTLYHPSADYQGTKQYSNLNKVGPKKTEFRKGFYTPNGNISRHPATYGTKHNQNSGNYNKRYLQRQTKKDGVKHQITNNQKNGTTNICSKDEIQYQVESTNCWTVTKEEKERSSLDFKSFRWNAKSKNPFYPTSGYFNKFNVTHNFESNIYPRKEKKGANNIVHAPHLKTNYKVVKGNCTMPNHKQVQENGTKLKDKQVQENGAKPKDKQVQENGTKPKQVQGSNILLVHYGEDISDAIVGSFTAMNVFLSFYEEWKKLRGKTLLLLEEFFEMLSDSNNKGDKMKNVIQTIGIGAKVASVAPDFRVALVGKIINILSDIFTQLFTSSPTLQNSGISNFQLTLCLEQDIEASSVMYMYGLQCDQQFQETCKLIEMFHRNIQGNDFENSTKNLETEFLEDMSKLNPNNHAVYYRRFQNWLEGFKPNVSSDVCKAFLTSFKDWPDAVEIITILPWRFHVKSLEGALEGWKEISQLLQNENTPAIEEILLKIKNSLLVLTKELTVVERDVMKLKRK